jgi:glyoxylase-like metal-dependent hydrolase (beta-lactamase superfamily II)
MKDLFFVERGYLNGNQFVYRSDKPVLIDTGYHSGFSETERHLRGLGLDVSRTQLIITTHCHCDHVGGNNRIQLLSGCDIAVHKIGKRFVDARDDWSTWWRYYDQEAEFFTCTHPLEDGQEVPIGPHRLRVIHTPGHAADGIVLYNEADKVLLSSDTLWETDVPVVTTRIEGSAAVSSLLESLEKIEALDVRAVFPGHGKPFFGFRDAIDKAKHTVRGYFQHPDRIGTHLIRRIIVYWLLMKGTVSAAEFFPYLMGTHWFPETVDFYFHGEYEKTFHDVLGDLIDRSTVRRDNGQLRTVVKP